MAQEMQVRYVSAYSFDAKWAGEFEIVMDQIRAPGYYRSNEKFSPKKWIFRWYYTEEGSTNDLYSESIKSDNEFAEFFDERRFPSPE